MKKSGVFLIGIGGALVLGFFAGWAFNSEKSALPWSESVATKNDQTPDTSITLLGRDGENPSEISFSGKFTQKQIIDLSNEMAKIDFGYYSSDPLEFSRKLLLADSLIQKASEGELLVLIGSAKEKKFRLKFSA